MSCKLVTTSRKEEAMGELEQNGEMVRVQWLMDNATFGDAVCFSGVQEMWDVKLMELGDRFIESVQSEGIKAGLAYSKETNTVYNGHHRLLLAWLLDIEYIAVNTRDTAWDMEKKGYPGCKAE
jgi:hypothetical protein